MPFWDNAQYHRPMFILVCQCKKLSQLDLAVPASVSFRRNVEVSDRIPEYFAHDKLIFLQKVPIMETPPPPHPLKILLNASPSWQTSTQGLSRMVMSQRQLCKEQSSIYRDGLLTLISFAFGTTPTLSLFVSFVKILTKADISRI